MTSQKEFKKSKDAVLGIDYGTTNIGLAIGIDGFVSPLEILSGKDLNTAISQINRIVIENGIKNIIVGLPLSADGKETTKSLEIRRFVKLLKTKTKRNVLYSNEYGTSMEATQTAIDMGISKKRRRETDHIAAALILKRYFQE